MARAEVTAIRRGPERPGQSNVARQAATTRLPRYRKLWRNSVIVTSLVALIPLIVLAVVNYHQDQEAYRAESHSQISRILSDTKRSLVLVIEEKCSAISMVIGEQTYDQLRDDARLKTTLRNLNSAFGGFVDLGVVDADGIQSYYAGPYEFKGKNYYNQAWFHEVLVRGAYVSDVFMGYRGLPHFVIAFKHETDDGKTYVLRATVDTELLNWLIHAQDLDRNTDAFVINYDGVLQTPSAFFGKILDTIDIDVPSQSRGWNFVEEYRENGQWLTCGYAYVARTSFILIAIKREPGLFSKW
ncbi:MAG: cache domain-containing protein, partial [Planctomycetota bacterium]